MNKLDPALYEVSDHYTYTCGWLYADLFVDFAVQSIEETGHGGWVDLVSIIVPTFFFAFQSVLPNPPIPILCVFSLFLWLSFFSLSHKTFTIYKSCGGNTILPLYQFFFQISVSTQDGIITLREAPYAVPNHSTVSPKVALKTVPVLVWLNSDSSQPWWLEHWPLSF